MKPKKEKLSDYKNNIFSQFGEDGIIEKIFQIIKPKSKVSLEFGAWDGFYLSNTANLWTKDWKGILIEGDKEKYEELKRNVAKHECLTFNYFVGNDHEKNSLDYIFKTHDIDAEIDLLSIDVDGNDYYIFESLQNIRPRVIICEFNPTIPHYMDIYAEYDNYFGASVAALCRVAEKKGYKLIAITDVNCFFVTKEEYAAFDEFDTDVDKIANKDGLIHIITSYSGEYLVVGNIGYGITSKLGTKITMPDTLTINTHVNVQKTE